MDDKHNISPLLVARLAYKYVATLLTPVTWNADIANEDERWRERDRGRIARYVDDVIDLLQAMGIGDVDCNVEKFISPLEERGSSECHHDATLGHKFKNNTDIEPCSC